MTNEAHNPATCPICADMPASEALAQLEAFRNDVDVAIEILRSELNAVPEREHSDVVTPSTEEIFPSGNIGKASDIAALLKVPKIRGVVRVPGECPTCLRRLEHCECKPLECGHKRARANTENRRIECPDCGTNDMLTRGGSK